MLTEEQLVAACKNIGFDLTCGACACLFYTGHDCVYEHDSKCWTEHKSAALVVVDTPEVES
jgi:hypothetical protein